MTIPIAAQITGLAFILYICDSLLLLYVNEGILTTKGRSEWRILFGSETAGIRGRNLFLPNPFVLHRPLFRLSWQFERHVAIRAEDWDKRRRTFSVLAPLLYGLAVLLFGMLPFALFFSVGDSILLITLVLLYLHIFGCIAWVYLNRKILGLSNTKFFTLAFECLVCPPIALNLIRRLSLQTQSDQDLINVAYNLLTPVEWEIVKAKFFMDLDLQMAEEDENSDRYRSLTIRRNEIAALESSS